MTVTLLLKEYFECTYVEAMDGLEAVNAFKADQAKTCCKNYFKIVFMDINMPVMDGIDSAIKINKYMKKICKTGSCSIVALTANQDKPSEQKCLNAGMKEVLYKPIQVK